MDSKFVSHSSTKNSSHLFHVFHQGHFRMIHCKIIHFSSFKLIPNKIEKFLLRSAFHDLMPKEVLWRSKEGFSEALGKIDLGDVLEGGANLLISEAEYALRERIFPSQTPETKEEFWYRKLFEKRFELRKLNDGLIHTKVYRF